MVPDAGLVDALLNNVVNAGQLRGQAALGPESAAAIFLDLEQLGWTQEVRRPIEKGKRGREGGSQGRGRGEAERIVSMAFSSRVSFPALLLAASLRL